MLHPCPYECDARFAAVHTLLHHVGVMHADALDAEEREMLAEARARRRSLDRAVLREFRALTEA